MRPCVVQEDATYYIMIMSTCTYMMINLFPDVFTALELIFHFFNPFLILCSTHEMVSSSRSSHPDLRQVDEMDEEYVAEIVRKAYGDDDERRRAAEVGNSLDYFSARPPPFLPFVFRIEFLSSL